MPRLSIQTTPLPSERAEIALEPRLEQRLRQEFRQYQVLKMRMEKLQEELNKRKESLIKLRQESGLDSINLDGYQIALVNGKRHFDRKTFVALGGDLKLHDAAMVQGEKHERITLPGQDE